MADALNRPLPWRVNYEEPRVVLDAEGKMLGAMDTADLARTVVDVVNVGDVDARAEVARLTETLGYYRDRGRMTPSERQSYLGEDAPESIQPEATYRAELRPLERALREIAGCLSLYQTGRAGGRGWSAQEALDAIGEHLDRAGYGETKGKST